MAEMSEFDRCVELYGQIVKTTCATGYGIPMSAIVAEIHEHDPCILAKLTDRETYEPGRSGVPNDIRRVIAEVHRVVFPEGNPFRNYGDRTVRKYYQSPRTRLLAKPTKKVKYAYARGWAVLGFECVRV